MLMTAYVINRQSMCLNFDIDMIWPLFMCDAVSHRLISKKAKRSDNKGLKFDRKADQLH